MRVSRESRRWRKKVTEGDGEKEKKKKIVWLVGWFLNVIVNY